MIFLRIHSRQKKKKKETKWECTWFIGVEDTDNTFQVLVGKTITTKDSNFLALAPRGA